MATLETMYPQVVGNHAVKLTSAFTAGTDTTISLSQIDSSAIPDATNKVTIIDHVSDTEEYLVTVKYTGISDTTLTGVTVDEYADSSSATHTYPIDSPVFRAFNKGDYDAFKTNITSINTELGTVTTTLANKLTKYTTMPTASSTYSSVFAYYEGADTGSYKQGHIYRCVESSGAYSWVELGSTIDTVDTSIDSQNKLTITLKSGGTTVATSTVTIITVSIVTSAYFNPSTYELVITFSNGQELKFSLTSLLTGLLPMTISFTIESADWVADGSTGNYKADLTTAINTILGQIPVYSPIEPTFTVVTPTGTENPSALHWCEAVTGGGYVLTEDTTVDTSKTYYSSSQVPATLGWYEKDSSTSTYSVSTDTYVNPSKTYFTRSFKSLNGTYQFNICPELANQAIIDAGTASQIHCLTTKENSTWKLYAKGYGGKLASQITLPVTMTVVSPSVTDMSLVGTPVYKSVASIPYEAWTITFTDSTTATKNILLKQ